MNIFLPYFFAFVLGAIIGSFLNVLILRCNTGRTFGGRSFCFSCSTTLSPLELVPIFSYAVQSGRCKHCKSHISAQYFLVEIISALTFLFVYTKLTLANGEAAIMPLDFGLHFAFYVLVFSTLLSLAVYDIRHKIIPNFLVWLFVALSLLKLAYQYGVGVILTVPDFLMSIGSGLVIASFFAALWYASSGTWMGFGDAKLALGIGWFLPFPQNITAIFLAFWVGAIVGIGIILLSKIANFLLPRGKYNLKTEIPFAPFLVLGTYLVFFLDLSILTFKF